MRTNIDIDDDLLAAAQDLAGVSTKKATVEIALAEYVRRRDRAKVEELFGAVDWVGDLDASRASRTG